MSLMTHGKLAPKDPSLGFFTSTISAPPSTASTASSWLIGLIKSFIINLG